MSNPTTEKFFKFYRAEISLVKRVLIIYFYFIFFKSKIHVFFILWFSFKAWIYNNIYLYIIVIYIVFIYFYLIFI